MLNYKLITIFVAILFIIYRKLKKIYSYWEEKGVKGPKPLWLIGNVLSILRKKESLNSITKKIYDMYPNEPVLGIYLGVSPTLILKNLDLIKKVTAKDFSSFDDRGLKVTEEMLSDSMFLEKGDKWKVYRQKLNPLFSTGRMKAMLPNTVQHINEYLDYVENLPPGPKELRTLDHKLSVKLLLSSSFGLDADPLKGDVGDLEQMGYDLLQLNVREIIATMLHGYNPDLPTAFGFKLASPKLEKFIDRIVNESKNALEQSPQREETFLDFMVNLKKQGVVIKEKKDRIVKVEISDSVLAAHATVFYGAGFEFFVNVSFLLFELALNQKIQERCYKEIVEVMRKYNDDLTFDATVELEYLNMAFDESLRKYPSGGYLSRIATKDYRFEDNNLTIDKGTKIIIPVLAIHHDPRYYPDPEVFDPERFTPEKKKMIKDCSYLPFGDGPRKCVGFRLARFQSILLLAKFLQRFKVTPCEKTVPKIRIVPYQFSLFAEDGLWVGITAR